MRVIFTLENVESRAEITTGTANTIQDNANQTKLYRNPDNCESHLNLLISLYSVCCVGDAGRAHGRFSFLKHI